MAHQRGTIEKDKAITGQVFYRVYTGCQYLDDYYSVGTLAHAEQIKAEMLDHYNSGRKLSKDK